MLKLIKEFIEFKKSIHSHTIEIKPEMQEKLDAFDYEIVKSLYGKTLDRLSKEMIDGELSADYVRWAKFALIQFWKHFKK